MFCNYKKKEKRNNINTCRRQKCQHLQNKNICISKYCTIKMKKLHEMFMRDSNYK